MERLQRRGEPGRVLAPTAVDDVHVLCQAGGAVDVGRRPADVRQFVGPSKVAYAHRVWDLGRRRLESLLTFSRSTSPFSPQLYRWGIHMATQVTMRLRWKRTVLIRAIAAIASACEADNGRAANSSGAAHALEDGTDGESQFGPWDEPTNLCHEADGRGERRRCVFGPWSAPVNMGPTINGSFNESHPWITRDGLSLYITTTRFSQIASDEDIAVSQRSSRSAPWSAPVRLGPNVNTVGFNDAVPSISEDGLDMYFHSPRPGGCGAADIYVSHRDDPTDDFAWQPAVNLGCVVNNSGPDNGPDFFRAHGIDYLYFLQDNTPGHIGAATNPNIVLSTRPRGSGIAGWSSPEVVAELNSIYRQGRMTIRRADGLEMCFSRDSDPAGFGGTDIYCSSRPSLSSPWSAPVNLGPAINTPFNDGGSACDFKGQTLYLFSDRPGGFGMRDLYTATRKRFCAPTARCHDVTVEADQSCRRASSINAGSSDQDEDHDTTCTQSPAGPFGLGSTRVTLTCTDRASGLTDSCTATVTVVASADDHGNSNLVSCNVQVPHD